MAVGQRPKLTLPILARINFFHKNDPNLFWFKLISLKIGLKEIDWKIKIGVM